MAQSVELLLDDDLDALVRAQWRALTEAGLPSQARHAGDSNRPHVTLAVSKVAWPDRVEAAIVGTGRHGTTLPLPLRLGGTLVFRHGRRHVLARSVVPSTGLLELHARIAAAVASSPTPPVPHTAVGEWTPHVTLAHGLRAEQLAPALEALDQVPGDTTDPVGAATAVRRWDGETRREWLITW